MIKFKRSWAPAAAAIRALLERWVTPLPGSRKYPAAAATPAWAQRMQGVHALHLAMQNASTPRQRLALRSAHSDALQEGMHMMMELPSPTSPPPQHDDAAQQQLIRYRMELMQLLMQMLEQRLDMLQNGAMPFPPQLAHSSAAALQQKEIQ
jgi:hypothetical protein